MEEEPQPCSQVGPSSPNPVGTAVAAESASALVSTSPVPSSPPEAELPAAALARAGGQEEPSEPLAVQQEEKAAQSHVPSEELPSAGTQSPVPAPQSPPGCSSTLQHLARRLSREAVRRAMLNLEQRTDVEMAEAAMSERHQSPLSPSPAQLGDPSEQQEGPEAWSMGSEKDSTEEASDCEVPWDSSSDPDKSQGDYDSDMELSPGVEYRVRELIPWEEGITFHTGNRALSPVMEEEKPQSCFPKGPSSLSPMGTAVAAEAAPALPRASPALQNPTGAEAAAAAPTGAGGQEDPPEPLPAQQEEKALETPVPSEELSSLGTENPPNVPYNTGDCSPASLCKDQSSSGQLLSQALLQFQTQQQQLEDQDALEKVAGAAAAAPAQREQSLVPGKSHMEEELRQQEGTQEAEPSQGERNSFQGGSQGQECPELSQEVSDWEECTEEEICHGEVSSPEEYSDWEEYLEKGLLWELWAWEKLFRLEPSLGDANCLDEVSDWEEHIGQALSQEEVSLGQDVSHESKHRPSVHSIWEDDSNPELAQEPWEVGSNSRIWMKPLAPEEDEWDELSVLELPPEEDHQQKRRVFAADGVPLPIPREAWVEEQALEPCSPKTLRAFPAHLQGQAPMGHMADSTRALHRQPCAPRKRPSCFRRVLQALGGLFRFRCLAAPPEE